MALALGASVHTLKFSRALSPHFSLAIPIRIDNIAPTRPIKACMEISRNSILYICRLRSLLVLWDVSAKSVRIARSAGTAT